MAFTRPTIIRPPSEWMSYYLPLTSGCSNNTCTFCAYCCSQLQIRDLPDVKREIDALALYARSQQRLTGIADMVYVVARGWDGRRVFLQDGDALVYPYPKLKEALDHLNGTFPRLERVAAYATAQDILRRSVEELRALRQRKLGILYVGVESGHEEVLEHVCKGVGYQDLVEAGRKTKEAGILLSVTVILGLGGVKLSQEHALATAQILSDLDPDYAGALTLTLVPGTPLYREAQRGLFHPISAFQSLEELRLIVEHSHFTSCFFSSMHASNYLSVRGMLPDDKEDMLRQLEGALSSRDSKRLRPEFLRGL